MKCQVPGCKAKVKKFTKKDSINCGIFLGNTTIYHCGNHTDIELEKVYETLAEKTQIINPIVDAQKIIKKEPKK